MFEKFKHDFLNRNVSTKLSLFIAVGFFIILSVFVYDKYQTYKGNYKNSSISAVNNTKDAIAQSINVKKRLLDNFVHINKSDIATLVREPDNQDIYNRLKDALKNQLPDLFTINIFSLNDGVLIPDFDGFIGDMCVNDLVGYAKYKLHYKRTHPNSVLYHYDEISAFELDGVKYEFFASFSLDEIKKALIYSTPINHKLMIISKSADNLIEITTLGGRDKQYFRNDFRLTQGELSNISSQADIYGTYWTVLDFNNIKEDNKYLASLFFSYGSIYFVFVIIVYILSHLINRKVKLLDSVNGELANKNKEIIGLYSELEDVVIIDHLTNLYNRRYFESQLDKEWSRAIRNKSELGIIMIDIDHFKKYNDHYGHVEGDNCLKKVSDSINACFSRKDEFVARFGGEEFIGVVNGGSESCLKISEDILKKLSDLKLEHAESEFEIVTVSIGVASLKPQIDSKAKNLVKHADVALYHAKGNGRNQLNEYQEK